MARGGDVSFYLETRGGALILQQTAKQVVLQSAQKIAQSAVQMSGSSSGHKANLKIVESVEGLAGKKDSQRFTATIIAADDETEIQLRRGNYIAKSVDAGKV